MFGGPKDPQSTGYSLRHPLVLITMIALGGAGWALITSGNVGGSNPSDETLSNIIVFLASGLLSYFITYANERRQFLQDMEKLASFSRRRVDLLSESLLSLAEEVANVPTVEEAKRIVVYTLRNLEQDARASVADIEDMGGIPHQEPPTLAVPDSPAQPDSGEPIATSIWYNCINCGFSNAATLDAAKGATQHVVCSNCRTRLFLHRLGNGEYRVVDPTRNRLSDYARASPAPPSSGGAGPAATAPSPAQTQKESFNCPRCQNTISFSAPPDRRYIEKPCFSCISVVQFDRATSTAREITARHTKYLESIDIKELDCPDCGFHFKPRQITSDSGRRITWCPNCSSIFLSAKDAKIPIVKKCPTPDCDNEITFKMSGTETHSKMFCLECASRVMYKRDDDEAQVIEQLNVIQTTQEDFANAGSVCPHCKHPASGRYKNTSRGRKLSICWNCKDVFEFV